MRNSLAFLILILSAFTLAQDEIVDRGDEAGLGRGESVARVTYAGKHAYLRRETDNEPELMIRNMSVVSGDAIETHANAYAEIELIDGSRMQIGDRTRLEYQAVNEVWNQDSLTVVRLQDGSMFLHTTEIAGSVERRVIRIDTLSGSAYVEAPGIYRIDMDGNEMSLRTYRGFAELSGERDSTAIYSGEYASVRDMRTPTQARPFNSVRADHFERWAYERRPANSVSSKYVDASVSSYARDLDDTGSWRYDNDLSIQVWVPFVESGWAPYRHGYWNRCGSYLSWVSYDPFGYLTHHYGRWSWRSSVGWFWIPGYSYSPAWVAWSNYDSYVGWCPLGYYNEPWYSNYNHGRGRTTVVVNNYWNYVPATSIINRRRSYSSHTVVVNGPRHITTRPFNVRDEDYRDSARFTKVISDPSINRRRAESNAATAGTILSTGNRTSASNRDRQANVSRVPISNRSTGSTAPSRLSAPARRGSISERSDDGNSSRINRGTTNSGRNDVRSVERRSVDSDNRVKESQATDAPTRRGNSSDTSPMEANPTPSRRSTGGDNRYQPPAKSDEGSTRQTAPRRYNNDSGSSTATPPKSDRSNSNATPPKRDSGRSYSPPPRTTTPPARSNSGSSNATAPRTTTPPARSNSGSTTPPKRDNGNSYSPPKRDNQGSSSTPPARSSSSSSRSYSPPARTQSTSSSPPSRSTGGNGPTRRHN